MPLSSKHINYKGLIFKILIVFVDNGVSNGKRIIILTEDISSCNVVYCTQSMLVCNVCVGNRLLDPRLRTGHSFRARKLTWYSLEHENWKSILLPSYFQSNARSK